MSQGLMITRTLIPSTAACFWACEQIIALLHMSLQADMNTTGKDIMGANQRKCPPSALALLHALAVLQMTFPLTHVLSVVSGCH